MAEANNTNRGLNDSSSSFYYLLKIFRTQIKRALQARRRKLKLFSAFGKSRLNYRDVISFYIIFQYTTKLRQNVVYSCFQYSTVKSNSKFGQQPRGYDDFTDSSEPIKPLEIFSINNERYSFCACHVQ